MLLALLSARFHLRGLGIADLDDDPVALRGARLALRAGDAGARKHSARGEQRGCDQARMSGDHVFS